MAFPRPGEALLATNWSFHKHPFIPQFVNDFAGRKQKAAPGKIKNNVYLRFPKINHI